MTNDKSPTPAVEGTMGTCESGPYCNEPHPPMFGCVNWKPLAPSDSQGTKPSLNELLESARKHVMTPEEVEAQRQSWVKGEMGISASERAEGRHTTMMKPLNSVDTPAPVPEPPARKDELGTCQHNDLPHIKWGCCDDWTPVAPQASPEHDLRKQDTPESKEHWDFVAEATARVEAMPEWKKNSVAVGGSPEATTPKLRAGMTDAAHKRVRNTIDILCDGMDTWKDRAEKAESQVRELTAQRDKYKGALENHLCEYDMADWVGCTGEHGKAGCEVCSGDGAHAHELKRLRYTVEKLREVLVYFEDEAISSCPAEFVSYDRAEKFAEKVRFVLSDKGVL